MLTFAKALSVTGAYSNAPIVLPAAIKHQRMSNWCWASIAELVSALLDHPPLSQCEIATQTFPGQQCCPPGDGTHGGNPECDRTYVLSPILGEHWCPPVQCQTYPPAGPVIPFNDIVHEIRDNRRPVACEIELNEGSGFHYVVIIGVIVAATPQIRVCDPLKPDGNHSDISFDEFSRSYHDGTWYAAIKVV